jgi:hypothetical protein
MSVVDLSQQSQSNYTLATGSPSQLTNTAGGNGSGFPGPATVQGLPASQRVIGYGVQGFNGGNGLIAQITVSEDHNDDMVFTEHPVEFGAVMSDHAFKRPPTLKVRVGWSNAYGGYASYAQSIYLQLLQLQVLRQLFYVYTGKRFYSNMLVKNIREVTDEKTEYVGLFDIEMQQIFLSSTSSTSPATATNLQGNDNAGANGSSGLTTTNQGQQQAQPTGYGSFVTMSGGVDAVSENQQPGYGPSTSPEGDQNNIFANVANSNNVILNSTTNSNNGGVPIGIF